MGEQNTVQPGVRINESVWKEFRQDVSERRGGVRGHLRHEVENALQEYLRASKGGDLHDRLRRIENKLEGIDGGGGDVSVSETGKKKKDSVSQTVENRLGKIQNQIDREAGEAEKVHVSVINKAIEDHAGASKPTLDRYKEMLKHRHMAFEWPDSDTWWLDGEKFVNVVEMNRPDESFEICKEYGEDWWNDMVEEDYYERHYQ